MERYELMRALAIAQMELPLAPEIEHGLWMNMVTLEECRLARIEPPQSYLLYVEQMLDAASVATIASESEAAQ